MGFWLGRQAWHPSSPLKDLLVRDPHLVDQHKWTYVWCDPGDPIQPEMPSRKGIINKWTNKFLMSQLFWNYIKSSQDLLPFWFKLMTMYWLKFDPWFSSTIVNTFMWSLAFYVHLSIFFFSFCDLLLTGQDITNIRHPVDYQNSSS